MNDIIILYMIKRYRQYLLLFELELWLWASGYCSWNHCVFGLFLLFYLSTIGIFCSFVQRRCNMYSSLHYHDFCHPDDPCNKLSFGIPYEYCPNLKKGFNLRLWHINLLWYFCLKNLLKLTVVFWCSLLWVHFLYGD